MPTITIYSEDKKMIVQSSPANAVDLERILDQHPTADRTAARLALAATYKHPSRIDGVMRVIPGGLMGVNDSGPGKKF